MRIAMVSEHANPLASVGGVDAGGQNVHVAALAAALTRRGHEVTVFSRRDDPGLAARVVADHGYVVEHVPAGPPTEIPKDELLPHLGEFARYLHARWAGRRYDLVHAHFWMSGLAALSAARANAMPVVQTFHALGTVKRRHQGRRDTSPRNRVELEKRLCQEVDHVVATCADEVHELRALGLAEGAATVVPCGVDVELFRPAPPADHRPPGRPGDHTVGLPTARRGGVRPRLLVVGRLVERKGVADVIEALTRVPEAELVVAGGPSRDALVLDPEVQRLRAIARATFTERRVRFLGRVTRADMPALFRACDVAITVPWYEPFGIVPLEAMACGRPVVGSAVGGLLDTVVPGVTGELVPPRDPERLVVVLRDLLADDERRAAYGAAGRQRALARYRWSQVAEDTERVYGKVCASAIKHDLRTSVEVLP